jgi:hypothetical protein
MNRTVAFAIAVAATLALVSADAWAGSGSVEILDLAVDVHATDASLQRQPSVAFSGGSSADTEITSTPIDPYGPPGFTITSDGVVSSSSAFGNLLSLTDLAGSATSDAWAFFVGANYGGPFIEGVGSSADSADFPNFAKLTLGGDSFTLSAHSRLVVDADLRFSASGGLASASLGFAGAGEPSWADATAQGSFERTVSLTFTNDTGEAEDGRFYASFLATSLPEPSSSALLAIALLAFASIAGSRSAADCCRTRSREAR